MEGPHCQGRKCCKSRVWSLRSFRRALLPLSICFLVFSTSMCYIHYKATSVPVYSYTVRKKNVCKHMKNYIQDSKNLNIFFKELNPLFSEINSPIRIKWITCTLCNTSYLLHISRLALRYCLQSWHGTTVPN